jgi:hypothetical protein
MSGGMAPVELVRAIGLSYPNANVVSRAYDPDQPRVLAGSGRDSGRWTNGSVAGNSAADVSSSPSSTSGGSTDEMTRPIRVAMSEEDEDPKERSRLILRRLDCTQSWKRICGRMGIRTCLPASRFSERRD